MIGSESRRIEYYLICVILLTSVFQLYVLPIAGTYFSLSLIVSYSLIVYVLINLKETKMWLPIFYALLLLIVHIISLAWAKDINIGILRILHLAQFIILFLGFKYYFQFAKGFPISALYLFGMGVIIQSLLVILFRISPTIEFSFLSSPIGKIFIHPNSIKGFVEGVLTNNVGSYSKAGGFFINGNVGAGFMGISALLFIGSYRLFARRFFLIVAVILSIGVVFSGSKSALFFLVVLLMLSFMWRRSIDNKSVISLKNILLILTGMGVFLSVLVLSFKDQLLMNLATTSVARIYLWYFGVVEFTKHPLMGHGFGGWQESIGQYSSVLIGFADIPPPHNNLIQVWSETGIMGLLVSILFFYTLFSRIKKLIFIEQERKMKLFGVYLFCAVLWLFLHGSITNWGIIGDVHIFPVLVFFISFWHHITRRQMKN